MTYDFTCTKGKTKPDSWKGEIRLVTTSNPYEMEVTARNSSFYIICGTYAHGNFLCIPSLGIGTELANLGDAFWNLERITMNNPNLSIVDAISIINGLKAISTYVSI